jgi:hypothetical protein
MASTRNNNTSGQYCLQQRSQKEFRNYNFYENSFYAYDTKLAGQGLLSGHMPWNTLSNNAVDIESFLYGVNSTNLVNPAPCLTPKLIQLQSANIYEKPTLFIPEPLVIEKYQRPYRS